MSASKYKKVLITGSNGFIGKNLNIHLKHSDYEVSAIVRGMDKKEVIDKLINADIIYHLAGINRPLDDSEFTTGNYEFTSEIVNTLLEHNKSTPIVFSSSTQVELDNLYGKSKRLAEESLLDYQSKGGTVHIYRLTNVFGKWCKPNYNSVVATFCNNIAKGLPIVINDESYLLRLLYIDDVIKSFISILHGHHSDDTFIEVNPIHEITLGELSNYIYKIDENRKTLVMPDLNDPLYKKLHATYLTYLDDNNFSYGLKEFVDNRGKLFELIKSKNFGQIFVSTTKPGITRGNHFHHTKNEKFVVIKGKANISLRNMVENGEVISYDVDGDEPTVVDIPPGYTHNITNIGKEDMITLFWANEIFDPNQPDTTYVEV